MRLAFYAPMKPPTHAVPSGDRRMARLLMAALEAAGKQPELAATLRSYEGAGDRARQDAIRRAGAAEAAALIERYSAAGLTAATTSDESSCRTASGKLDTMRFGSGFWPGSCLRQSPNGIMPPRAALPLALKDQHRCMPFQHARWRGHKTRPGWQARRLDRR